MIVLEELNYPEERVKRLLPKRLEHVDIELFKGEVERTLPRVSAKAFKHGSLFPNGILFNGLSIEPSQFNTDTSNKVLRKFHIKSILSLRKLRRVSRLSQTLFVTNSNSRSFFHWFLDVLQKIEMLERNSDIFLASNVKILIPLGHSSCFIANSLRAFSLSFYQQSSDELILLRDSALFPDVAPPTGNYRKELVIDLQRRLRSTWLRRTEHAPKISRIYISRKNASKRRIVNEDEILPILQEMGVTLVDFDSVKFDEQVSLVLNCNILIALHGAGLTHMLWIREKSKVMEIRAHDDSTNNCYYVLASDLGHDYHYALADKLDSSLPTQEADVIVDPALFKRKLIEMLEVD